jgi:translation initiation factor eIF-2B subunit beta
MANGGLVTYTGAHMMALAAQAHSIPFIVISGMYKLTPLYGFDIDTYNQLESPSQIFRYSLSLSN